ncbi:hypothetical protein BDU57DRAFT_582235 [Ampelomyces quisqualis]|uniref:NAD(P)-binding protein n=1 Tax=Ampelomyces quisqualis TaxID=50730 RepID=A0A6A5QF24_AMPQU|nr:hypothetical protein BDU57DRAFT_582235 [Ampelomyces quisqualis]
MSTSNYNFKTTLVNGGAGDIGKALAHQLIKDGKKVIIACRTDSNLQTTSKEIGAPYYVLDTSDVSSILTFIKNSTTEHPGINSLIDNAAESFPTKAYQQPDINIWRPMHLLSNLPTSLIVNISSVLGFAPSSIISPVHNATKLREYLVFGFYYLIFILLLDSTPQSALALAWKKHKRETRLSLP